MSDQPIWITNEESACMRKWTDYLHGEAKRLFIRDGTHVNLLFCFNKEHGLVSVNPVPQDIDQDQLDTVITHAVIEHNLYGVVFIGETWMYFIKENDHTAFQLLDGEMKVSDLNDEDKGEALIVRMENRDEDCLIYLDEIKRDENSLTLKECKTVRGVQKKWFQKDVETVQLERNH
jgi:hypothetical protein